MIGRPDDVSFLSVVKKRVRIDITCPVVRHTSEVTLVVVDPHLVTCVARVQRTDVRRRAPERRRSRREKLVSCNALLGRRNQGLASAVELQTVSIGISNVELACSPGSISHVSPIEIGDVCRELC